MPEVNQTALRKSEGHLVFCLHFNIFCSGDEGADSVFNFTYCVAELNCCREEMLHSKPGIT